MSNNKRGPKLNALGYKVYAFILVSRTFIWLLIPIALCVDALFLNLFPESLINKVNEIENQNVPLLQLTPLGILITLYVFLLNVVRKRESLGYAKKNTHTVIQLINFRVAIILMLSITTSAATFIDEIANQFEPVLFYASVYIIFIELLLIFSIIGHRMLFFLVALKALKKSNKRHSKGERESRFSAIEIFQRITDLEQMIKQVYTSHADELAVYLSQQVALGFIFNQKGITDQGKISDSYVQLIECRNNSIIINERSKRDISEIINISHVETLLRKTEEFFLRYFFRNEYFRNTVFAKKNFGQADFSYTTFDRITFLDSELDNTTLRETLFKDCLFNKVSLKNSNCEYANFSDSKFILDENEKLFDEETKLNNAKFDGARLAKLEYTPNTRVTIQSATFRRVNFDNSKMRNLKFELTILDGASFFNSKIVDVVFSPANLNEVNFAKARIEKSSYNYTLLSNANFYKAELKNCNDPDYSFCGAMLKFVKFDEAVLGNIDFSNAFCGGASFDRAELADVSFERAFLGNTSFSDSKLWNVNLSFATLEYSLLSNICMTARVNSWNKFEKTEFNHTRFICKKTKYTKNKPIIQYSYFKNAFFSDAYLMGYTISVSWFEHSTFLRTRLSDITFENTPFSDMVFNNVRLISVVYKSTQNEKGIMEELQFKECEFNRVKFFNIQMENTTFLDCEFLTPEQVFFGVELNNVKFIRCSFPTNKSYRDFFRGTNAENMNKSERKKYVEILTDQKNDLADENDGGEQPTNETT